MCLTASCSCLSAVMMGESPLLSLPLVFLTYSLCITCSYNTKYFPANGILRSSKKTNKRQMPCHVNIQDCHTQKSKHLISLKTLSLRSQHDHRNTSTDQQSWEHPYAHLRELTFSSIGTWTFKFFFFQLKN